MCFNETASLIAFMVGIVGQSIAVTKEASANATSKTKNHTRTYLSMALSFVVVMQLYEVFMHRRRTGKSSIQGVERMAMLTNFLQPVAVLAAVVAIRQRDIASRKFLPFWIFMAGVNALYFSRVFPIIRSKWDMPSTPVCKSANTKREGETSCNLKWPWYDLPVDQYYMLTILYLVNVCAPLLMLRPKESGGALVISIVGLLSLSNALPSGNKPSSWCFLAVLLPWVVIFIPTRQRGTLSSM